jgi:hypothetical protein
MTKKDIKIGTIFKRYNDTYKIVGISGEVIQLYSINKERNLRQPNSLGFLISHKNSFEVIKTSNNKTNYLKLLH